MSTPSGGQRIAVLEADVLADWVRVGRGTVLRITVRNPGPPRDFEVSVTHDGVAVTTATIPLTGGGTATHDVEVVFREPRSGAVEVAGVPAGEVTVAPLDEQTTTPKFVSNADGGIVPGGHLVVAFVVALWARRSLSNKR